MSALKIAAQFPAPFSWHSWHSWRKPWVLMAVIAAAGVLFSLAYFTLLPLVTHGYDIPISAMTPQASPGSATAGLVAQLSSQNFTVQPLDTVTHSYLAGHGTILGFAGDNIQVFEYPDDATARQEAYAIFQRVPWLATKNYFHVFLSGNLIGLYVGHNANVLQVTEEKMGPPLAPP